MVFDGDIANNNNYKSFEYKTKLLWNRAEDDANKILRNATISVPLKYLNKFWRSPEMPLIYFKFKWTKHYALSATVAENANGNPNSIIFTIKDTKLYVPVVNLLGKDNQKLSRILRKGFERSVYWN